MENKKQIIEDRILVVGGAGYIGGAVTDNLTKLNVDFLVLDNLIFEKDYRKKVPFILGDVRDKLFMKKIINDYNPTAIIWLAAIVGDAACQNNPELTINVNQKSVKWLSENYDGRIVYTSTCSVYGKNDVILYEDSETNPLSLYAETKLECEKYLKNKNAVIFRLGTLFGVSDEFSRIRLDLVVNILSMKAIQGEDMTVFGGEQWRPLLHVKDAANAIVISSLSNSTIDSGIYNIAFKNMTIKELALDIKKAVEEISGKLSKIKYSDISFEDARNYKVNCDKYKSGGRNFSRTVIEGAKEIMDLIKSKRIKNPINNIYHNAKYMKEIEK